MLEFRMKSWCFHIDLRKRHLQNGIGKLVCRDEKKGKYWVTFFRGRKKKIQVAADPWPSDIRQTLPLKC